MATTIVTKNGSGAPAASDLVAGELAVDLTNGRLYTEDSGGSVIEIGLNPSGNVDVTGSVTADGFTLTDSTNPTLTITDTTNPTSLVLTAGNLSTTIGTTTDHRLKFDTNDTERFRIENNGDISFYEDTGTTPKLFWDASAESLGIGTSSPNAPLEVAGAATTSTDIAHFSNSNGVQKVVIGLDGEGDGQITLIDAANNTDVLFTAGGASYINTGGNFGIGTSSPKTAINASTSTGAILTLESSDTTLTTNGVIGGIDFYSNDSSTNGTGAKVNIRAIGQNSSGTATALTFGTSASGSATAVEAMRIDASGNVGIGTASPAIGGGRTYALALTIDGGVSGGLEDTGALEIGGSTSVNDRLVGSISYFNRDNSGAGATTRQQVAIIEARSVTSDSNAGDDSGGNLTFGTKSEGGSIAERMRIDSSGNLLVGKTSTGDYVTGIEMQPAGAILSYRTTNVASIFGRTNEGEITRFTSAGAIVGSIATQGGEICLMANSGGGIRVRSNMASVIPVNVSRSNLDATTDLGSSSARFKDLYLSGNATHGTTPSSSAAGAFTEAVGRTTYSSGSGTGGFSNLKFINGNGTVGTVTTSGSATAYNTSSDYRLKENVVAMSGATERLKQLKPSRFNFIADADTTVDGFLAHEVQDIVPEAISGTKDAVDADGNPEYQGIDQSKLVPLLVATIQELEARIAALES